MAVCSVSFEYSPRANPRMDLWVVKLSRIRHTYTKVIYGWGMPLASLWPESLLSYPEPCFTH